MIFAAGFGTRMKHLTKDRPKPMVEVNGTALIDHTLALAQTLPAARVVANLHYKPDALARHLAERGVETILETPDILDTGGGLRNALPLLGDEPVITLNSDAIWCGANPLSQLVAAWDPERMDGLLMCVPKPLAIGYTGPGNFLRGTDGRISRGPGLVYGGAQIIKTDLLHQISENAFSLNTLWDLMITKNSLYAVEYAAEWCDVGYPEGITLAEKAMSKRDV